MKYQLFTLLILITNVIFAQDISFSVIKDEFDLKGIFQVNNEFLLIDPALRLNLFKNCQTIEMRKADMKFDSWKLCHLARVMVETTSNHRMPLIGAPSFRDKNILLNYWPNLKQEYRDLPFIFINGFPVLINEGYSLGGQAENPTDFLEYCLKNGKWRNLRYDLPNVVQVNVIERDLSKLPLFLAIHDSNNDEVNRNVNFSISLFKKIY